MNEEVVQSMSLNKILVAILEEHGPLSVPTIKFMDAGHEDKELVIDYDDVDHLFNFNVRGKNEHDSIDD
jgi:hypothetical protein